MISKRLKRVFAMVLIGGLLFAGMGSIRAEEDANGVSITKTAQGECSDYLVEFQIPDIQKIQESVRADVVLVLDKSSVSDLPSLKQAASDFIDYMANQSQTYGIDFKVGVIWFNVNAHEGTDGLLSLSDAGNVTLIKDAIQNYGGSGTNLQGGLLLAEEWLEAADANNKYVYLASDFAGYLYSDGAKVTLPTGDMGLYGYGRQWNNGGVANGYWVDDFANRYGNGTADNKYNLTNLTIADIDELIRSKKLFNTSTADANWMDTVGDLSMGEMLAYQMMGLPDNPSEVLQLPTSLTVFDPPTVPTAREKSTYLSGNVLLDLKDKGYELYAITMPYQSDTPAFNNLYSMMETYQEWFAAYIGHRYDISAGFTPEDAFTDLEKDIFYLFGQGRLTDVINDNFELIPGTVQVTLDNVALEATDLGNGVTGYGTMNGAGEYPYTIEYNESTKTFIWNINESPLKTKIASFSYRLRFVDMNAVEPGVEYATNKEAYLEYLTVDEVGSTIFTNRIDIGSPRVSCDKTTPTLLPKPIMPNTGSIVGIIGSLMIMTGIIVSSKRKSK